MLLWSLSCSPGAYCASLGPTVLLWSLFALLGTLEVDKIVTYDTEEWWWTIMDINSRPKLTLKTNQNYSAPSHLMTVFNPYLRSNPGYTLKLSTVLCIHCVSVLLCFFINYSLLILAVTGWSKICLMTCVSSWGHFKPPNCRVTHGTKELLSELSFSLILY